MEEQYPLLETIECIEDLKKLPARALGRLAAELRGYIIDVVSRTGGHLASNLGVVELTIALHRVFNSPADKIIWDVGHQTYAHKILTGRKEAFKSLRQYKGVSGFPKRCESAHDVFETGHSSTSISAGLGILCGQGLQNIAGNVIAVIGDGSLTGGIALEALNNAAQLGKRLIIVLNDNNMSIGQNVGALSIYLTMLTTTRPYKLFRNTFDKVVRHLPLVGGRMLASVYRLKRALKAVFFRTNFFADLGYEYVGPLDGHNIHALVGVFKNVEKNFERPTVIHVATKKGKGYNHAETDPSLFHGVGAFSIVDGKLEKSEGITFTDAFGRAIVDLAAHDQKIVAVTAAMSNGTGLDPFAARFPRRFFDVGIAEQHAVTFAAGLAQSGLRPVVAIYSTFIQRAVDQVIHDVALQKLPVVFALDRAGLVGHDGETHHGAFDIQLFRGIPNIIMLAPANSDEMRLMLEFGLESSSPVIIRYPRTRCLCENVDCTDPLVSGRGVKVTRKRGEILIVTLGGMLAEALAASVLLEKEEIAVDVYHLRFIKPIDADFFQDMIEPYSGVLFVEDGVVQGGLGEYLSRIGAGQGTEKIFSIAGIPDQFIEQGSRKELLHLCGLDAVGIAAQAKKLVGTKKRVHTV